MATDNSQCISLLSSSLRKPQPQNPYPVDYIGSFMTLVSKYGLRYQGFLYHLNHDEKTLCLINVTCYGTEGRNHIGFHIPPSYQLYSYIVFTTTQIKAIVDSPASLARGLSTKIYRLPKPPLPYAYSSYNQDGAKIRQNVPLLISNEKLSKTEAIYDYDASLNMGSVNDGLQIACKPLALQQYPSSNYYDPWLNHAYQPMPCAPLYQDPTYAAPSSIASQSFFTTYPSVRFSLGQGNGGFDFEALTKNFKPYKLWGPEGDNKQEDQTAYTVDGSSYQNETWNYSDDGSSYLNEIWNYLVNNNQEDQTACTIDGSYQNETCCSQGNNNQEDQTAYTVDGSYQNETCCSQGNNNQEDETAYNIHRFFYMNSRNPFDPMGRPCNPFSPIERPFLPSSQELADLGFV
ncbi:hypothetical protein Bca52824_092817 [Brassica carinata]|uniref:Lsm14-like N-terminal domain-containing protein n=1 Tax=Brassica carinata TaxID=52824 RepID=A0A8X7P6Y4_BRACI|nr:hypothetical protein Bca52824_092817 [Brassica carinata]